MRVLLCGYGNMGKNHFRVLQKISKIKHIDIYDPYGNDIPVNLKVDNIDKYLSRNIPNFAILATPTITHGSMAEKLLGSSVPTLIEKPIASTAEEGKRIQEISVSKNIIGAVGFVERFNPVVDALRNEISSSTILSISITRVGPFPPRIKDVGVLVDLSVHDIDLVRFLLNGAEILESRVYKSHKNGNQYEDNAIVTMRVKGDVVVNLTTNWLTPFKKRTIEVATDKAYYEANLITQELHAYSHYKKNNSYVIQSCNVSRGEPLIFELKAFLNLVETGDYGFLASYADGIQALQILEKQRLVTY